MESRSEMDDESIVAARTLEGFGKLRLGFKLSIVSVVLLTFGSLFYPGLYELVLPFYFMAIYNRAGGWRLLGFGRTQVILWVLAAFAVASPFIVLFSIVSFGSSSNPFLIVLQQMFPSRFFYTYALSVFSFGLWGASTRLLSVETWGSFRKSSVCV